MIGTCPLNDITLDFSGDIFILNCFMLLKIITLSVNKFLSESDKIT